jgi:hypothetical protein
VGFFGGQMAPVQVSLRVLQFSTVGIILPLLHTYSFICHSKTDKHCSITQIFIQICMSFHIPGTVFLTGDLADHSLEDNNIFTPEDMKKAQNGKLT